jgi:stringent starvation protein B
MWKQTVKARTPSSKKPYLLRAMYEWIVDNDLTPHILLDANAKGVFVPPSAVKDERVLLNIAPRAVFGLNLGNDMISFKASFGGAQREVSFPLTSVLAIYSREDIQHGIVFGQEEDGDDQDPPPADETPVVEEAKPEAKPERKGRANLRVVK